MRFTQSYWGWKLVDSSWKGKAKRLFYRLSMILTGTPRKRYWQPGDPMGKPRFATIKDENGNDVDCWQYYQDKFSEEFLAAGRCGCEFKPSTNEFVSIKLTKNEDESPSDN